MGLRGTGVGVYEKKAPTSALYSRCNAILHSSSRLPFYSHSHPTITMQELHNNAIIPDEKDITGAVQIAQKMTAIKRPKPI